MNRLTLLLSLTGMILLNLLPACSDWDDNISTNPNYRLQFSVDTVSFDTVFTSIGSATQKFLVYNPNSKPLKISSIDIADNDKSGFRINVDGRKGDSFSDITILEKDSLYILVEVTVDPTQDNQPFLLKDSIVFVTNGNTQNVKLEAYGRNATIIKGGLTFDKDTLLKAERPYLIYDSMMVAPNVTLQIEQGAEFYMYNKAKWKIEGTLEANGSQEAPILFRGDRLDNIETNLPYDRVTGQWDGIYFETESFDNKMDYVIVRNTVHGIICEASTTERPKLSITQSQFTNSDNHILHATNCYVEVSGTEFSNSVYNTIVLIGGKYSFIHCTLANYITTKRSYADCTLLLTNSSENENVFNMQEATFENCIIDGRYGSALKIEPISGNEMNYKFNYCAIHIDPEKENFMNTQYGAPDYKLTGRLEDSYVFDFRLTLDEKAESQVAIGKADKTIAEKYPYDRYGIPRIQDGKSPDIGAYVYVEDTE